MEFVAAIFYNHFPVIYRIFFKDNKYEAKLERYHGDPACQPPKNIRLFKEGRRWKGDIADQNVIEDLGLAIEVKAIK
jgi:hypothetical protein